MNPHEQFCHNLACGPIRAVLLILPAHDIIRRQRGLTASPGGWPDGSPRVDPGLADLPGDTPHHI